MRSTCGITPNGGNLNRNECMGIIGRRVPRVYFREGKPVHVEAEMDAMLSR